MSETPEYNINFPKEATKSKEYYKEEVSYEDELKTYIKRFNNHPRTQENGLFLIKKWYIYIIIGIALLFFLILIVSLFKFNTDIKNINDKQLNPTFPVNFEHNSSINVTSETTNNFQHEITNTHEIINQLNFTTRYEIDQDAIDDIIHGINDNLCNNLNLEMVCSFYQSNYNCTVNENNASINFEGYFNDTKISGIIEKI